MLYYRTLYFCPPVSMYYIGHICWSFVCQMTKVSQAAKIQSCQSKKSLSVADWLHFIIQAQNIQHFIGPEYPGVSRTSWRGALHMPQISRGFVLHRPQISKRFMNVQEIYKYPCDSPFIGPKYQRDCTSYGPNIQEICAS